MRRNDPAMLLRSQNGSTKKLRLRRKATLTRKRERDAATGRWGETRKEKSPRMTYLDFSMPLNNTNASRFLYWFLSLLSLSWALPGPDGLMAGANQPVPPSLHRHRIQRSNA